MNDEIPPPIPDKPELKIVDTEGKRVIQVGPPLPSNFHYDVNIRTNNWTTAELILMEIMGVCVGLVLARFFYS